MIYGCVLHIRITVTLRDEVVGVSAWGRGGGEENKQRSVWLNAHLARNSRKEASLTGAYGNQSNSRFVM